MNLFFFTGDNLIELEEKLNFWKQEFIKKHSDANLEVFDEVTNDNVPKIINSMDSAPFLAEKRMIIVKGFPLAADAKKKIETENLEKALKTLPDFTLIIFVSSRPDKRSRFYKWLSANARVEEFSAPQGRETIDWIRKKFQRHQKSISPRAAESLLFFCGEDLNRLNQEINKLSLLGEQEIDEKIIEKFVTPNPEARIFKVLDMVGKTSQANLLKDFSQLAQSGEDLMMVFYMIVRQFRLLTQVKYLKEKNIPRELLHKHLKLAPFQIAALAKQADSFSFKTLRDSYGKLIEIEYQIKTGRIPMSTDNQKLLHLRIDQFLCTLYE